MRCPSCGEETPGNKRFCANCGRTLGERRCASCGSELIEGKPFCADCGAPASPGVSPPAGPSPAQPVHDAAAAQAERRICSVLFVDLVGFTPLSEKKDPEAVRELLSVYFERAQTIIRYYGGVVEKFIGDAVMAVWGAPRANEDDAERAVRAGLEIVAAVGQLGEESATSGLEARGGVVTGEVATTVGALAESLVLGDTVNSASRLQSAAQPGTLLVDESTWRASTGAVAFADVGALRLKGKEEPFPAWQALRVVAQRRGVGRTEGLEPPFVGRDGELRLVKDMLHATIEEGRARLVSVTGVPGIGKSRLLWEFLKYVDGLAGEVNWHQGRSPAYGEGVTFFALSEMVRARARIGESDEPDAAKEKLGAALGNYVKDVEERRWIEPRLSHLLGLSEAPPGDREELFSAWRTFFEKVASTGPTLMVFEDLQRADQGMIDFVESIPEWSRNHPILVVTLARPELADRRPTWGAGQRSFTSLHLEGLPVESMRRLLDGYVHGLPERFAEDIVTRAEGVPLYLVEMVRALVGGGSLAEQDGSYAVTGDLTSLEVPETLHAVIGARLDALPPEQRALLQDAAVLGVTFSASALATLEGVVPEKLDQDLRDLVRKEFLTLDQNPLSPERGLYSFVQSLIFEVARSRLSRKDRSAKHLAAASHLESLDDPELTAAVASHYLEAYRALPEGDEAAVLAESAREWLSRAGERALSLGSPEQAEVLFGQAIEVTDAGAARTRYLELAAKAAMDSRHYERAIEMAEEAVEGYDGQGDVNGAARSTAIWCQALGDLGRSGEAIDRAEQTLAGGDGIDDRVRAEFAAGLAFNLAALGNADDALRRAETALAIAEQVDDGGLLAMAFLARSMPLFGLGRHQEAGVLARHAARLAEEAGALRWQGVALTNLSVYLLEDDPVAAMSTALEAADLARRAGNRSGEVVNLFNAAESSVYLGKWDHTGATLAGLEERVQTERDRTWLDTIKGLFSILTGRDAGREWHGRYEDTVLTEGNIYTRTTAGTAVALARLATGDLAGAVMYASSAIDSDPNGINVPQALAACARACLWQRDAEGVRAALEKTSGLRGRFMAALRLTVEAGLLAVEGDQEASLEGYGVAFEAWAALGCTVELCLSRLDAVVLLGPEVAGPSVVEEAREGLSALGAVPFLERLEEAVAGRL